MSLMGVVSGLFAKLAARIATGRRLSRFTCGDCEFSDRCDLPPTAKCLLREEQIVRGHWKMRRQARAFFQDQQWT